MNPHRMLRILLGTLAVAISILVSSSTLAVAQGRAEGTEEAAAATKFDIQADYTVDAGHGPVDVVMPIAVAAGAAPIAGADATVKVVGVDRGQVGELGAFFQLSMGKAAEDPSAILHVGDTGGSLPDPGTYRLVARVAPKGNDASGKPAVAFTGAFNLTVPAAVVAPTPKVEVVQEVFCPLNLGCWGEPHETAHEDLSVRETTGAAASGILSLEVSDVATPDRGEGPTVSSDGGEVAAGSMATIPYTVGGDPDPGTYTATLQLTGGPGIAASDVALTVTRRQSGWTFVLLAFVGLVAGLALRELVIGRIDRRQAVTDAATEQAKILAAAAGATDATFRTDLEGAAAGIAAATAGKRKERKTTKEIAQAVTEAKAARKEAAKEQVERLNAAVADRNAFDARIARITSFAVGALQAPLAEARKALAPVDDRLVLKDGAGAKAELAEVVAGPAEAVRAAAQAWAAEATTSIQASIEDSGDLPREVREAIGDRDDARNTLAAVASAAFEALEDELGPARQVASNVDAALGAALTVFDRLLRAVPDPHLDPNLRSHTADLRRRLATRPVDRKAAMHDAANAGASARTSLLTWAAALDADAAVQSSISVQDYLDAVRVLASTEPPTSSWGRTLGAGATDPVVATAVEPVALGMALGVPGDPNSPAPHPFVPPAEPPPVAVVVDLPNPTATWIVKALLLVCVGMALLFAVYLVVPDTMVGTTAQQLAVLLWAASLPPTYEGLSAQLPKLLKSPA